MQIKEIQPAPHIEYDLTGNTLTIGGLAVNLASAQGDTEQIIDICRNVAGSLICGMGDAYVASILIPPAKYHTEITDETDANGSAIYEQIKEPLDTNAVKLLLWQYSKTTDIEEE